MFVCVLVCMCAFTTKGPQRECVSSYAHTQTHRKIEYNSTEMRKECVSVGVGVCVSVSVSVSECECECECECVSVSVSVSVGVGVSVSVVMTIRGSKT